MPLYPSSDLDASQCIQGAYDDANSCLRVEGVLAEGAIEVAIDASTDNIAIKDPVSGHTLKVNADGSINTDVEVVLSTVSVTQGTTPWVDNVAQFGGNNVVTGTGSSGVGIPRVTVSNDSNVLATQSGSWTTGRTWSLNNTTDSVNVGNFPATQAVTQSTTPWVDNITQFGSNNISTGTGASGVGIPRVTVSNDSNILATQSGTWNINNISGTVSLPTGASTSANQTNGTQTTQINQGGNTATVTVSNALKVDGSAVTQPISGTVTANQGSANAIPWNMNVADFGGNVVITGTGTSGLGIPRVTVSNDSNVLATQSGTWNITNVTGTVSLPTNAAQETGGHLASIDSKLGTLGQKTMAGSAPVVIASDQSSIPVSQSTTPWVNNTSQFGGNNVVTGTGASGLGIPRVTVSNDSNILATQSGTWNINNVSGTVSLPTGASTSTLQTTGNSSLASILSNQTNGTQETQVTNFPAVQPVSQSGTWTTGRTWDLSSGTDSVSAVQSGTWTVQQGTSPWITKDQTDGPVTPGAVAAFSALIGAQFNTTLPTLTNTEQAALQTDANGRLIVNSTPVDGTKATYSASIDDLTVAATPTDIFTITGSATKTVRVTRISFSGNQNTSGSRDILLIKRSAANTGGTSTTQTNIPHDSTNAAGTATVRAYTANPTALGASVGTVRAHKIQLLATNVTNALDNFVWEFGNRPSQAIVLRGIAEVLAINLNSVTSGTSTLDIDIEWTEE